MSDHTSNARRGRVTDDVIRRILLLARGRRTMRAIARTVGLSHPTVIRVIQQYQLLPSPEHALRLLRKQEAEARRAAVEDRRRARVRRRIEEQAKKEAKAADRDAARARSAERWMTRPWLGGRMQVDPLLTSRPNEEACAVYLVTNLDTGKRYVGKAFDPAARSRQHESKAKRGPDTYFEKSLRTHGPSRFLMEVLSWWPSEAEAFDEERRTIAALSTKAPSGYNLANGGGGEAAAPTKTRATYTLADGTVVHGYRGAMEATGLSKDAVRRRVAKGRELSAKTLPQQIEVGGRTYSSAWAARQAGVGVRALAEARGKPLPAPRRGGRKARGGPVMKREGQQPQPVRWLGVSYPSISACARATGVTMKAITKAHRAGRESFGKPGRPRKSQGSLPGVKNSDRVA